MHSFFVLQKSKVYFLVKVIRNKDIAKSTVILSFLGVALLLAIATYKFTLGSLSFVHSHPDYLDLVAYYMLAITFFLIFVLTLVSSVISAIGMLFIQDDDDLLLAMPLDISTIFTSRLLTLILFSSWPVLVFGIPTLLAFQKSFSLGSTNLIIALASLAATLLASSLFSALLALKITSLGGKVGKK